ncbi:MAG: class I SAM-dependent methyltransferase [Candidatus Omnitrophota bacterium]|nr:class I SAM-dependent methyltransferase [Candidatus Omnitrophota bacterium]
MEHQNKREELSFFNNFVKAASEYDVFDNNGKHKLINLFQNEIISVRGKCLLDIGCGTGVLTSQFSKLGAKAIGVDISAISIATARKQNQATYLVCDAESLCFKDNAFDIVTFCAVLHHFPNLEKVIWEAFRVLKTGGKIFSFDPHRANLVMFLYRDRYSPLRSTKGITKNERLLSKKDLEVQFKKYSDEYKIFCASGITYSYVEISLMRPILKVYNFLEKMFDKIWLSKYFGSWIFGVAKKP